MFSQPLHELVVRFRGRSLDDFLLESPHPWLVLEAGPRLSPVATERTQMMPKVGDSPRMGLATAYPLTLEKPCNTVGRDVDSDVCISDAALSRAHFILFRVEGGWSIRDARSTNGTFLDGRKLVPIQPHPLRDGSQLQAGHLRMRFYEPMGMFRRLNSDAWEAPQGNRSDAGSSRTTIAGGAQRPDTSPSH